MPDPAPRVRVDLRHQGGDVVHAVPGHLGGGELGRDDPAAHDQGAVVGAADILLDQDQPAVLPGHGERGAGFRRRDGDEHVAPVVAADRLDHHGTAEVVEGRHGLLGAAHGDALGHRNARRDQELLGHGLVAGDVHAYGRGLLGARRPDQPPAAAVAQLEQGHVGQPADRDIPVPRGAGQLRRTDPQPFAVVERGDLLQLRARLALADDVIRSAPASKLADEGRPERQQLSCHLVLGPLVIGALEYQPEPSRRTRPERPAKVHITPDEARQLQGDVLQHVTEERTLVQLVHQAARPPGRAMVLGQPGQAAEQPGSESRELPGLPAGELLQVDQGHRDRVRAVHVRAT